MGSDRLGRVSVEQARNSASHSEGTDHESSSQVRADNSFRGNSFGPIRYNGFSGCIVFLCNVFSFYL